MSEERLDKLLCGRADVTRSEARKLIKAGRVLVDGLLSKDPEQKFNAEAKLRLDGELLGQSGFQYIMMNKPQGVLSATEDKSRKTVLDLLPEKVSRRGLFPVGRLDKDTTGLLIITDDGEFSHRVTSPKKNISKLYEVWSDGKLTEEDEKAFTKGLVLKDGTRCLPAALKIDDGDPGHSYVKIYEGKYHQVKRMFASRGKPVYALKRIAIGGLRLDETLEEGGFRSMTAEEAAAAALPEITK